MLRKIAIIGPESTGKSSLCQRLAEHYQTEWCPEYAREFLLNLGRKYNYDDLLVIAKGQVALEDSYLAVHSPQSTVHSKQSAIDSDPDSHRDPTPIHRHRNVRHESLVRVCLWEMPSLYS